MPGWGGKMLSRTEGDTGILHWCVSAQSPEGEETRAAAIPSVDIVMKHRLQETSSKMNRAPSPSKTT